jgi:hypothetical protein
MKLLDIWEGELRRKGYTDEQLLKRADTYAAIISPDGDKLMQEEITDQNLIAAFRVIFREVANLTREPK